ncbi:MAG TPA: alpha-galactosidase [Verrucomicrobiae bacterium]|jgi:alpha-galactosidase|nr:alpha-galactosidase [Verrucomicrobiae bacterium]
MNHVRLHIFILLCATLFAPVIASNAQQITVSTAHSSLVLTVGYDGRLYQSHYGKTDDHPAKFGKTPPRETEFQPQYGDGFILEPAVQATHADGNTSTALVYVTNETQLIDTNVALTTIQLKDSYYHFFVTLFLKSYANEDIIEQWTAFRHDESAPVTLSRFASSAPVFPPRDYWLTQFHGDYETEATMDESKLPPGMTVLDSKIGVRASRFRIPSFLLSVGGPAHETNGEVYGGSLEWSGSYQLAFEVDFSNRLRALCGINPFAEEYHLKPGETFTTPAMLWTWSDKGEGQVSRNFHDWARHYGIRDAAMDRPVLLNNWEATEFKFNEKKIVSLFDGAREIGAELFLLDDGWFGNNHPRNDDHAGLGDWQVNTNKLPHGLSFLADAARSRGLRFGIWMEPEMVDPRSDLFEQHPDWAIQEPHRPLELSRHQLDLDLSRPAVQDFVWQVIDNTLSTPGVSFTKWDANRYVTQPGSPYLPPSEQSELLIDYGFALYKIMAHMAEKFPNVMAMACSGGGGRVDYGALKYFHSFWPSDNTDPLSRVFIQWGFSHFFPAEATCCHVTRTGHRPLKFALDVAMSGALGVDMDLSRNKPEDNAFLASAIKLYKNNLRAIVQHGDLYRLESPYNNPRSALDFISTDKSRAVLFIYQVKSGPQSAVVLQGLDPQRSYRVHEVNLREGVVSTLDKNDTVIPGSSLMQDGLISPCQKQCDSAVIELTEERQ